MRGEQRVSKRRRVVCVRVRRWTGGGGPNSPVGGRMLLTKMKMAFSGLSLILFLMTYTNCPAVRSPGTRYFFLSISGISLLPAFSTMTGILSGYFSRILIASAWRFSAKDERMKKKKRGARRPRVRPLSLSLSLSLSFLCLGRDPGRAEDRVPARLPLTYPAGARS